MAGGVMKQPRRIQKVPARPSTNKQRTEKRPAPRKADPVGKPHAGPRPAAGPVDPILQAQRDAEAAEAEVAKISRAHLATLMASPPRARMAHFKDPELTPADRIELEQSVRSALPRSAPVKAAPSTAPGYLRRLLRVCGYKCAVVTVLLAAGALIAGTTWHNTGERMVASNATWIVDWRLPDGSIKHGGWNAGLPVIAMSPHNGKVVLKYWLNGLGYATTEVDENWLRGNSFDYVVAPTGGTGAVSPTSR
jgi:hypothetical protein